MNNRSCLDRALFVENFRSFYHVGLGEIIDVPVMNGAEVVLDRVSVNLNGSSVLLWHDCEHNRIMFGGKEFDSFQGDLGRLICVLKAYAIETNTAYVAIAKSTNKEILENLGKLGFHGDPNDVSLYRMLASKRF